MKKKNKLQGRPKGHDIPEDILNAMNMVFGKTDREIATLCADAEGKPLTPQAISYWRRKGKISGKYLRLLAEKFYAALNDREPSTKWEKELATYLGKEIQLAVTRISGSAVSPPSSAIANQIDLSLTSEKAERRLDPPPTSGFIGAAKERSKPSNRDPLAAIDSILANLNVWELAEAIEKRGYEVFIRRKGPPKEGAANE